MRGYAGAALVFALVVSCAERPSRPSSSAPAPSQSSNEEGDRIDPCDMCVLQSSDASGQDEDGCPVPDFQLGDACAVPADAQPRVSRAAKEIRENPHMTIVRLVSANPACAAALRKALVTAGVPAERLETATRGTGAGVSLEVGQFDGRRCTP